MEVGWSQLEDPVSAQSRRFSGDLVSFAEVEYRRDIPGTDWAYRIGAEYFYEAAELDFNEISRDSGHPGDGFAFVEQKDLHGVAGYAGVSHMFNQRDLFGREHFERSRTGALTLV